MALHYSCSHVQDVAGPVYLLPQRGSYVEGDHGPVNAFAVLRVGYSILIAAPFSWMLEAIDRLYDIGTPSPSPAPVLTHRHLAAKGDAFEALSDRRLSFVLHACDQFHEDAFAAKVRFSCPLVDRNVYHAGLQILHMPGRTEGSVMVYIPEDGGILLAGNCDVGPNADADTQDAKSCLRRRANCTSDERFDANWRRTTEGLKPSTILPLHGRPWCRNDMDAAEFEKGLRSLRDEPAFHPSSLRHWRCAG